MRSGGPQVLPRDENPTPNPNPKPKPDPNPNPNPNPNQVLPRDEEEEPVGSLSWDVARGSPSSWEAGSAAIFDAAEAASAAARQ